MPKLFNFDGKILNISLEHISTNQLEKLVGGELDFIPLKSDDVLVVNRNQEPDVLPPNDLASALARRSVFGPVVLCEPQELD